MHIHGSGGKLNTHLDYSIHPKLKLERRLNLIVYLNPDWQESWGGSLGLWRDDNGKPGELVKSIAPMFNRAVVFDTTGAWHGLPEPITCPVGQHRKSLAVYYLCDRRDGAVERNRALFAPTAEQAENREVMELIKRRSK
jgi:Rps23 Pro-64 3,4-dihydroxylase Tpa1-like proline 4-hydroxylase